MRNFMLGDVVVFPELNRLQAGGREVAVEPKVMALLEVLAEHAPDVVSRRRLLERVWAGTVVGDEALTRCVSQLRAALGDRASRPVYVQTVPKRGYRLLTAPRLRSDVKPAVRIAPRAGARLARVPGALAVVAVLLIALGMSVVLARAPVSDTGSGAACGLLGLGRLPEEGLPHESYPGP